jgi:hypothetical protein
MKNRVGGRSTVILRLSIIIVLEPDLAEIDVSCFSDIYWHWYCYRYPTVQILSDP